MDAKRDAITLILNDNLPMNIYKIMDERTVMKYIDKNGFSV